VELVNKTRIAALLVAPALTLTLAACGGNYSYAVSGHVVGKKIDWDCDGHAMAPVAFTRTSRGSGAGTRKNGTTRKNPSIPKAPANGSGGVPLKKQPHQPRKLGGFTLPHLPKATKRPKGCSHGSADYEMFIKNDDGIFEQDVTSEHYERCEGGEKFPACTAD
jgi:hypothetical protein